MVLGHVSKREASFAQLDAHGQTESTWINEEEARRRMETRCSLLAEAEGCRIRMGRGATFPVLEVQVQKARDGWGLEKSA